MQHRVGNVAHANDGARGKESVDGRFPRFADGIDFADILVFVASEFVALEEAKGLGVGQEADGQNHEVVLALAESAFALHVFVLQLQVPVVELFDARGLAFHKFNAHALGLFVELVVALAEGADVDVVDGHVGQRQRTHHELGVLDGIHAADPAAERVADRVVARAVAEHDGNAFGLFAVRRPQYAVVRAGRCEQAIHLQTIDHVRDAPVAEQLLCGGVEHFEAGREHHRADGELFGIFPQGKVDAEGGADVDAFHALGAFAAVHAAVRLFPCLLFGHHAFVAVEGLLALFERHHRLHDRRAGIEILGLFEHDILVGFFQQEVGIERNVERFAFKLLVHIEGGAAPLGDGVDDHGWIRYAVAAGKDGGICGLQGLFVGLEQTPLTLDLFCEIGGGRF